MNTRTKKFIIIVFIIIVAVFAAVMLKQKKQAASTAGLPAEFENIELELLDVPVKTDPEFQLDSDKDGVADWEERLWNLNPFASDTDGDGIFDKEALEKIKKEALERAQTEEYQQEISESDKLGRGLYTALLAIEVNGGDLSDEDREQIENNVAEHIESIPIVDKEYTAEDFIVVSDGSDSSYAYRDEMDRISKKYDLNSKQYELIARGVEDKNAHIIEIREAINTYDQLIAELALLRLPSLVSGHHLDFINNLLFIRESLAIVSQNEPDGIEVLSIISQSEKVISNIKRSLSRINTYFDILEEDDLFDEYETE